ncbi:7865_t:CDS:2, partial [Gigaspora rosea]
SQELGNDLWLYLIIRNKLSNHSWNLANDLWPYLVIHYKFSDHF